MHGVGVRSRDVRQEEAFLCVLKPLGLVVLGTGVAKRREEFYELSPS